MCLLAFPLLRILSAAAAAVTLLSAPVNALTVVQREDSGDSQHHYYTFDATVVDGHPAVVYAEGANGAVKYVRATDPEGTAWGSPVALGSGAFDRPGMALRVVNGHPAVCFVQGAPFRLTYVSAADAAGAVWNAPVPVLSGSSPGYPALDVADGNPAIGFTTFDPALGPSFKAVNFVRALDPDGAAWGSVVEVRKNVVAASMAVVAGRPAFAWITAGGLSYTRAADAAGTAWLPEVNVSPVPVVEQSGCTLSIVNGTPAIAFGDDPAQFLKYVRSTDASGTVWGSPVAINNSAPDPGAWRNSFIGNTTFAVAGGKPAVVYGTTYALSTAEALDESGTVWKNPVYMMADGTQRSYPVLLEAAGRPAVVFVNEDRNSIEYTRAAQSGGDGGIRWLPFILVDSYYGGAEEGAAFGLVGPGETRPMNFTLRNTAAAAVNLLISSVTIEGPDAAEFSITTPPLMSVHAGAYTEFTVTFAPLTPLKKSAVLRILTNAESPGNNYTLPLYGDAAPQITVELAGRPPLPDGGTLALPVTLPGQPAAVDFVIRNPGASPLQGVSVTIDGPDRAEYSLTTAPASIVPRDGHTTFTLRHAPQTSGSRSAALHIASSVPGAANPFDLTVRMAPGTRDLSFPLHNGTIETLALRPGGSILAAQSPSLTFPAVNAFLTVGGPDNTFFPPFVSGGPVMRMAVQRDGGILLAGSFRNAGDMPRRGLARLLPSGDLDLSFDAHLEGDVECLAIQPDGKILAGISDISINGEGRYSILRLMPGGTADAAFNVVTDGAVLALAVQPDGKVLAGGEFQNVSGAFSPFLVRLGTNGTVEALPIAPEAAVDCLALRPDGTILAALRSGPVQHLSAGGERLAGTAPLTSGYPLKALSLLADGRCLFAGLYLHFDTVASAGIGRLNPDITIDTAFLPPANFDIINTLAVQPGGQILAAGMDVTVGEQVIRMSSVFHRLSSEPGVSSLAPQGRTALRWMRGGPAPEVSDVSFEVNTPGDPAWQHLGFASRIPGGWELSGLTLPASCRVRALGRDGGSLIEETVTLLTPLESWRLQYFSTSENTGNANDDADPDHDGLTNFTEYAFGLNPVDRASNALPEFKYGGNLLTATFTAPDGRTDLLYNAEWSSTMLPGTWTETTDTGAGEKHVFSVPAGAGKMFVRFVVRLR
jgi:uncharacterized delta-60 repeat protein